MSTSTLSKESLYTQACTTFGVIWKVTFKSFKRHLRQVIRSIHLMFEELTTTLTQVKACLYSRPMTPTQDSDEGIELLTPGYFPAGSTLKKVKPLTSFYFILLLRLCPLSGFGLQYMEVLVCRVPRPDYLVGLRST